MKRILALLFCLLLLGVLTASFTAEAVCVRTDKALSEKENAYLQSLHDTIRKAYGIEAFLVFNYDYTAGEAFRTYARAFLDEHAVTEDAVVFAVSADNYYMNTRGKAGELLRDDDLDLLYDAMAEADENGEQYKAAVQFYTTMNALLSHRVGSSDPAEPASGAEETELTAARVQLPGSVPIPDEISPTRGDRLVDQADLLSDAQEDALQQKLDEMSERLQFDVVIVTCEHIGTRTPMEFADDYFDYNGFGYGENYDGVALLISMAERDWWVSTCGYGQIALSDDYFLDRIDPSDFTYHLKKGNYDKSFTFFADTVDRFVTEAKEDQPYSKDHRYHLPSSMRTGAILSLICGCIAAAVTVFYQNENYTGTLQSRAEAGDYLVGKVNLREKSDELLYTKEYREKRVTASDSSSGGSSSHHSAGSHVSSSGRTHGGGGGKF